MNVNNKNNTPFKAEDVNWEELLSLIHICRKEKDL